MELVKKITERLNAAMEMRNLHAAERANAEGKYKEAYEYHNQQYMKFSAVVSELAELLR